ncbi:thiopurine S-methyltransferase [Inmirania thermothiophila]|uniref:Thiopurine S-methyltransferase n=1 Tax=Inmirania thermothiophila TaxID=1750597 RepID=A0A3N1Y6M1_9GAMM|nr:thiopurine S-methyltransferase [Inmirania thermothiophila]ROR34158.1 thiopurine S-methyltransferase [Inmirania thermothiophila]
MDPKFWIARWEQGQTGWHLPEVNPQLRRWWARLGLAAPGRVFVPLCGASLDLGWLAGRGHEVVGCELAPTAVARCFAEAGLEPAVAAAGALRRWRAGRLEILEGDFFRLDPETLGAVEAVYDRAALVAFPPAMRAHYVAHLRRLAPRAPQLLVTLDYPQEEMEGPPFAVPEAEVRARYAGCTVERLADEDVLEAQPRFRARGLTRLREQAFLIRP